MQKPQENIDPIRLHPILNPQEKNPERKETPRG
jgi:hypothetical protein